MSKLRGPRYHLVFVQPNAPQLEAIGKLMAQGKLTIPIERELPLERARRGCLASVGAQQQLFKCQKHQLQCLAAGRLMRYWRAGMRTARSSCTFPRGKGMDDWPFN